MAHCAHTIKRGMELLQMQREDVAALRLRNGNLSTLAHRLEEEVKDLSTLLNNM